MYEEKRTPTTLMRMPAAMKMARRSPALSVMPWNATGPSSVGGCWRRRTAR